MASIVDVVFEHAALRFVLADGREVSAPLEWLPALRDATEAQRYNWRLIGRGIGVHWLDLDEDVSVSTLLDAEQKARLDAVAAMPDEQIDYSDAPALPDAVWVKAATGLPQTKPKRKKT
ncbi:DUF2442 domain-containing protein [Rhodobacteraceae bacterium CH30]|nr:DUF2442 domain-containing protein [Rhodobacteraceae bacterium CH30]